MTEKEPIELINEHYYILEDVSTKPTLRMIGMYVAHDNTWIICGSDTQWPAKDFIVLKHIDMENI